jgi:hypothetical protein
MRVNGNNRQFATITNMARVIEERLVHSRGLLTMLNFRE